MADRNFKYLIVELKDGTEEVDELGKEILQNLDEVVAVVPVYSDGFGRYMQSPLQHPRVAKEGY